MDPWKRNKDQSKDNQVEWPVKGGRIIFEVLKLVREERQRAKNGDRKWVPKPPQSLEDGSFVKGTWPSHISSRNELNANSLSTHVERKTYSSTGVKGKEKMEDDWIMPRSRARR